MKTHKREPAVSWLLQGRKKPIAYSTKAVSDFIVVMARTHDTIQAIHDAINYDMDAKAILREYIDAGYGDAAARDMFE